VHKPWEHQEKLKKEPIPSPNALLYIVQEIPDQRVRCLAAIAYLTGGRITEIVREKYSRRVIFKKDAEGKVLKKESGHPVVEEIIKIPLNYQGIKKENISVVYDKERQFLLFDIQNRKNKDQPRKFIPIMMDREKDFIVMIDEYLQCIENEEPLFKFGKHRAYQLLKKYTGYNCHYFRHIRATHLVTHYGLGSFELEKFLGWTDNRPAKKYVRLSWKDIWR